MIVHGHEKPVMTNIGAVLDFALAYNPMLAVRDLTTINYWIADGCDIEKDILPTMQKICERKKGISSFNYFTKAITTARDLRVSQAKVESNNTPVDGNRLLAIIQWKLDRGLPITVEQQNLLDQNKKAPTV